MRVRVVALGSGSIVPTAKRFASAFYIDAEGKNLLLDCGPGTIEKMRAKRLNPFNLKHVFLTHFHIDHVEDLPALIKLRAYNEGGRPVTDTNKLSLYGPKGLSQLLTTLIDENPYFSYLVSTMKYRRYTEVIELESSKEYDLGRLKVSTLSTRHFNGLAYRLELSGKTIVYSGDTVPDEGLAKLAEGADLLIHECSFPDAELLGLHTSERGLAEVIAKAKPKALLVTHLYPSWEDREEELASVLLSAHRCKLFIAEDGTEVVL